MIKQFTDGNKSEFAKRVKKQPSQISRILRVDSDEKIDSPSFLIRLQNEFAVNPDWLVHGKGPMIVEKNDEVLPKKLSTSKVTHIMSIDRSYNNRLVNLEEKGRIAFFNRFPSSIYLEESFTDETIEQDGITRKQNLEERVPINKEYYSIESVLLFGFSRYGYQHDKETKKRIIRDMLRVFQSDYKKEIIFIETMKHYGNRKTRFGGGNLLFSFKDKVVLAETPVGFIEINDEKLWYELKNELQNMLELPEIRQKDSIEVLETLLETIERDGGFKSFIEALKKKNEITAKHFAVNIHGLTELAIN